MASSFLLSNELQRAIQIAQAVAREYSHPVYGPGHLLKGILHNDVGLGSLLTVWGIDVTYLRDWADVRIESTPKSARLTDQTQGDAKVQAVLEVADVVRMKLGESNITPLAILVAISRPDVAFSRDQLKRFPVTETDLLQYALQESSLAGSASSNKGAVPERSKPGNQVANPNLDKFCQEKTSLALQGKLEPIIGRDREIRQMLEILGRRTKPNVIITGEPGVGKTALVDGLAQLIVAEKVPPKLRNSLLLQLDMGALIAGASYKGEIEDRLKNVIAEVKQHDKALLFIDEIHILMEPGSGAQGLVNLLKPDLARGELTVIGATTLDEYRKYIEKDGAFSRRFELLSIEEPNEATATRMVNRVLPLFEKHHEISLAKDASPEAVRLAKRYLKDRRLPDAAIDLIDRTMAAIYLMHETTESELTDLSVELKAIQEAAADGEHEEFMNNLHWFNQQLQTRLSPVLLGQVEEQLDVRTFEAPNALADHFSTLLERLAVLGQERRAQVEKSDIAAVVAHKTGIPLGKVQSREQERLLALESYLQKRVVGQDLALKIIGDAVRENRAGLNKPGQPIGSFFLLGPTGTGKTELSKSIAEFLFNDEKALIRFDMSEFKEAHSVALLYGAPPGYVGYEEGGLLVNKIRQQPFAVVLFDEIEKAHPDVFDLFLQILGEGKMHDRLGREGDFSNAIILFTSNIGSKWLTEAFGRGETPTSAQLRDLMSGHFRPEFLGRLTEIIPFRPISQEIILNILNIQLQPLLDSLQKQGITLTIEKEVQQRLAQEGFTPEFGARPLVGVIRNRLRRPLSTMIVSGEIGKGSRLEMVWNDEEPAFKITNPITES